MNPHVPTTSLQQLGCVFSSSLASHVVVVEHLKANPRHHISCIKNLSICVRLRTLKIFNHDTIIIHIRHYKVQAECLDFGSG